jgi:hypothetical protein
MKRFISVLIVAVSLAGSATPASAHHSAPPCAVDASSQRGAEQLIRCATWRWEQRFGPGIIPGGARKAIAVERCESSGYRMAQTGRFGGYFQIGSDEWPGWEPSWFWTYHPQASRAPPGRFSGRFNVLRALSHVAFLVRHPEIGPWHGDGWGPWSCG